MQCQRTSALIFLLLVLVAAQALALPVSWDSTSHWQTLETSHFVIVFPEELVELAQEAGRIAELAHDKWQEESQYSPPGKTYLVLTDRSDITTVTTSTFPHNAIVIDHPFGWTAERRWDSPRESWLFELIFAAYGRIVTQVRVQGMAADVQAVLGKFIMPGWLEPLWFREAVGLLSSADPQVNGMVVRGMIESNGLPTLAQLSTPHDKRTWPPVHLQAQAVGSLFLQYLERSQGPDILNKLSRAYAQRPLSSVTLGALAIATGQSLQEAYQQWQEWAREDLTRSQQEIEAQGETTRSTPLTARGYLSQGPAWSPSGDALVYYHADGQGLPGLRLILSNGEQDRPLLECECGPAAWLTEFTLIYPKLSAHQEGSFSYDLYRYDLPDAREERLTNGERIYAVEPFPDGHRLLVARNGLQGKSSLVVLDLISHSRLILKEFDAGARVHSMAVSPDGSLIALSLWVQKQGHNIYLLSAEGGDLLRLTEASAIDLDPIFSLDGRFLLYSSNRDGTFNLYALRLGDRQLFQVTRSLSGSFDPALSSDGQRLAFVRYSPNGFNIHRAAYEPTRWSALSPPQASGQRNSWPMGSTPPEEPMNFSLKPYDPAPALIPTFWLPLVGPTHVGIYTWDEDPLGRHGYELSAGMKLDSLQPFYEFTYTNAQFFPRLTLRVQRSPAQEREELLLEFPFDRSARHERTLTLGLDQEREITELFLSADLINVQGLDLYRRQSSLSMTGALAQLSQGLARRLTVDWSEELQLPVASSSGPHDFVFRAKAAWGDREEFRLGGVSGEYPLRGFADISIGTQLLSAGAEYRFPVWSIDWGCCGESAWPLFLDELRGSLLVDVGAAGATLELDQLRVALGLELQLKLILSYGLTEGWFRLGIAYGIGSPQPQVYFAFEPAFRLPRLR